MIWRKFWYEICVSFQARNLKHNPETYIQFNSLAIPPPISSKEVPLVIEKLKSKKVLKQMSSKVSQILDLISTDSLFRDQCFPGTIFDFINKLLLEYNVVSQWLFKFKMWLTLFDIFIIGLSPAMIQIETNKILSKFFLIPWCH